MVKKSELPETPSPNREGVFLDYRALEITGQEDAVIASFDGVKIRKHQVYDYLQRQDPMQGMQLVNALLAERLATRLAQEEKVRVPASEVDWWVKKYELAMAAEVKRRMGADGDLEEFIALQYGKGLEEYQRWQRTRVSRQLVKWYAMVYLAMKEASCTCRVISVAGKEQAKKLRTEALNGADFQVLARKYSLHPSGARGGHMVPLTENSGHPLAKRIFAMQEGEICKPIQGRLGKQNVWSVILLAQRNPGHNQSFKELEAEVARRVRKAPPSIAEVLAFFCSTRERFGLRLFPETK